jgi:hypothetical protein
MHTLIAIAFVAARLASKVQKYDAHLQYHYAVPSEFSPE